VISSAQRRLYLVLGNGQALSYCHRRRAPPATPERHQPGDRQAPSGGLDAAEEMLQRRSHLRVIWRAARTIRWAPRDLSRREPLSHSRFERA